MNEEQDLNLDNNNNSKFLNKTDLSDITQDFRPDLLIKLKEIHQKSEERTFDLNEKFNQIKDGLQNLIDNYQNNLYKEEEPENYIDYVSLQKYINNYINNEREISINNINNVFEKLSEQLNSKIEKNSEDKEDIKTSMVEIKNEFDGIYDEALSHFNDTKNQKDEINNKIDMQMEEQFEKINDIINNEFETEEKGKNEIITLAQDYLRDIGKKMKKEKIER